MYRRRIFFDLFTGDVLYSYIATGALLSLPPDQEAGELGLTSWGVFAWDEPDPQIEAAMLPVDADGNPRRVLVSVDVAGAEPRIVITYEPITEAPAADDPYAIIDTLTGEVS